MTRAVVAVSFKRAWLSFALLASPRHQGELVLYDDPTSDMLAV